MNTAIIFAGGTGQRMNSRAKPKQFLELHGKPILVYTIEKFQRHQQIDHIIVVCIESWLDYCVWLVEQYRQTKVAAVVPGGPTGQESIFHGLEKAYELYGDENPIVLIHDGVRPLIDADTISRAISCTEAHGSAITVSPAVETVAMRTDDGEIRQIIDRSRCQMAKAPQCFFLKDIYNAHLRAQAEQHMNFIDSASLMRFYGHALYTVECPAENIKITTPSDYYMFRAISDAQENSQILGF